MERRLSYVLYQEGDGFVARCLDVNVASEGDSEAEAIDNLREALELYFEELSDFGALYGSLGALMALLIFVYAVSLVLVFGAEYASEWSRLPDEDVSVRTELRNVAQGLRRRVRRSD